VHPSGNKRENVPTKIVIYWIAKRAELYAWLKERGRDIKGL